MLSGKPLKKVLIIQPSMFLGGVETSLIGLLDALVNQGCRVDLFLYRHEGEMLPFIPARVNLLPQIGAYTCFDRPIVRLLKSKYFMLGAARILSKAHLGLRRLLFKEKPSTWKSMQYTTRYLLSFLPEIGGGYDLALMFHGIPAVLAKKAGAGTKLCWIHTDYHQILPEMNYDRKMYAGVDWIVHVSEASRQSFLEIHPGLADKTIVVENILPREYVLTRAEEADVQDEMPTGPTRLLSIGRYAHAKNFDNVPDICARLRELGHDVVWYLIGYGEDEGLIRAQITRAGMDRHVIMLGKKANPYPYIKACDLYVQPSRFEGKSVAVREAQTLGKPVVITNYRTAGSQVRDGIDGVIVPLDNDACAKGIGELLSDKDKLRSLAEFCASGDFTNSEMAGILMNLTGKDAR